MRPIQKHQTIIDLALLNSGSLEAFFEIALLNGLELTQEVNPGTNLLMPEIVERRPVNYYQERGHIPITGVIDNEELAGEGLEFWAIENDFIIT